MASINVFDCHKIPVDCIGPHIDYPAFIRLGGVVSQPPSEIYRTAQRAESPIIHPSPTRDLHLSMKASQAVYYHPSSHCLYLRTWYDIWHSWKASSTYNRYDKCR